MTKRLTMLRLFVLEDALNSCLAGEIDENDETEFTREDYQTTLDWVQEQIRNRMKEKER